VIRGLHHVAVVVPDFERALAFYTDTLGFTVKWRSAVDGTNAAVDAVIGMRGITADIAMLQAGGAHVELWQYHAPEGSARHTLPCDTGYAHIALDVADIHAEYQRLVAAGMTFGGPPVDLGNGSFAIYGRDPFDNLVELYQTGE
jgi:glyoxylase I family protein